MSRVAELIKAKFGSEFKDASSWGEKYDDVSDAWDECESAHHLICLAVGAGVDYRRIFRALSAVAGELVDLLPKDAITRAREGLGLFEEWDENKRDSGTFEFMSEGPRRAASAVYRVHEAVWGTYMAAAYAANVTGKNMLHGIGELEMREIGAEKAPRTTVVTAYLLEQALDAVAEVEESSFGPIRSNPMQNPPPKSICARLRERLPFSLVEKALSGERTHPGPDPLPLPNQAHGPKKT
jgi:hypothetical protein